MTLFDLLFPPRCPYCGELTGRICESCEKCSDILAVEPHFSELKNGVRCISALEYDGVCSKAVLNYKYHGCRQYGKCFALTMERVIKDRLSDTSIDVYTSVPTLFDFTGARFDHVKEFTKRTARLAGAEYRPLLKQTRKKKTQHELKAEERLKNVEGLYSVTDPALVKGKNILLFDDIVTSGATLCACADELLGSGAAAVACATLEWTPLYS